MVLQDPLEALVRGRNADPFAILGPHRDGDGVVIRSLQPHAESVDVVDGSGRVLAAMRPVRSGGLFEARLRSPRRYRLRVRDPNRCREIEDPYRFGSPLGDVDRYLLAEGRHARLYEKLGARVMELEGVSGVHFAVWAPNAARVSVVGAFNDWDGRRHPMRHHPGGGVWDIFIPGIGPGAFYKFELLGPGGRRLPWKADPYARRMERPPGNASIVCGDEAYPWTDGEWMAGRSDKTTPEAPVAIYEVHIGSWRRRGDGGFLGYRELADALVPYVAAMGYTHVELLPVTEHPFDGSWGYQPVGLFAPTWRFGEPDDFKYLVDRFHRQGIGVIMDWVPGHFPRDDFGLGFFDGTHLYEHADPRQGAHQDWGTLIFNFGRNEVVNYLLANALYWLEIFHIDALRVDAVASMLYLDYSREPGQWVPNRYGGNENLEAVAFLRRMNELVHAQGCATIAEESTTWPMVSRPAYRGGLGFTFKWNMGWMNDTLSYMKEDPVHRRFHHQRLTFGLLYAFSENFVLPLSHDEVVHGKGSLLARMPGDAWRKFANLRLYYAFMYGHPGKKLLFMGGEFAQIREWNHDTGLDWGLLADPLHAGVQHVVRDLNRLYTQTPALYRHDVDARGFEWIDCADSEQSVIAFMRRGEYAGHFLVFVCNFTPVVRYGYRIGVPESAVYRELFNSDAAEYGGSGVGNCGAVEAEQIEAHGRRYSLNLTLPPLAALILAPSGHDAES